MSFKTLMVHVDLDGQADARIRLAADLAVRFDSALIGIAACAPPPAPFDAGIAAGRLLSDQVRDIKIKVKERSESFRRTASAVRREFDWRFEIGPPANVVAREARAADLLIVGRSAPGRGHHSLDPGNAILHVGRPVLVVPSGVDVVRARHVVIGWKDTREARRAVQDSLPFLHEAEKVTVAEVCPAGNEEAARRRIDDVARYLTRHRINVGARIVAHPEEKSAAEELMRLASEQGADLIVVGGYGRSRLGEWILGGVTRDLLASCPVCCLFAH
jgi:nucleotide-binding universal stress UspA family protein